ncbi:MAG: nitronate monooxygenase [Gammaproteobacteria bacterium AqS3]|nr:nitronate monooxygenase [Gammaproteobacteria bacterium AqS3]
MALPSVLKGRLRIPVIGSPLFIVSGPELVIAQCKAGIVGSFPALNARPEPVLDEWLERITAELDAHQKANPDAIVAPYAVNQICHTSNDRLEHDVMACVRHKVPIVITSLRAPVEVVQEIQSYGGIVIHDVINMRHARRAIKDGVNGLVPVCSGAGGHAGTLSPFALVSEMRAEFGDEICIALSGAIGNGASVLGALSMGADVAYIGSRFIASEEANADPGYKQMLVDSSASDIVYSSLFTGVHGNYLSGSISNAGLDPQNLPEGSKSDMNFGSGGNTEKKAWKDIWGSGQGIAGIEKVQPIAEIVDALEQQYHSARERVLAA